MASSKNVFSKDRRNLVIAGLCIGVVAVLLVILGNPKNMGFCIACFIRDIAGATKLHSAGVVQYMRPEILGLVLGAFVISLVTGEFKPRGGSSPVLRFLISAMVMIGALAFLGCPFRMILRLSAGDLNALIGLVGFTAGIAAGAFFLNRGFSLGRAQVQSRLEGAALPSVNILLLILAVAAPALFAASESGPGSMHAAIAISLVAGLFVGVLAQRTRLCMVGGIRDTLLLGDATLLLGFAAIFIAALLMNIFTGNFKLGFAGQPVAHTGHVWNFLGMFVVGLGSVLVGGCPLRQLILAGEGNTDSAISVLGMFVGAAIAHNFDLAGKAGTTEGLSVRGRIVVIACAVIVVCIASIVTFTGKKSERKA